MSSSDDDDDFEITLFPIFGGDESGAEASDEREDTESEVEKDEDDEPMIPPPMSLRQRRLSKSLAAVNALKLSVLNNNRSENSRNNKGNKNTRLFGLINEEFDNKINLEPGRPRARRNWLIALKKVKTLKDPWAEFHIENIKTETCTRHRYHPHKRIWVKDEVFIKMETKVNTYDYSIN